MATYKTPGVYVEEISTLPASIAQVETAVPAFIGVTEKAEKGGEEVKNQAVRITSLVDFQEIFGAGPPINITEVVLNNDNSFSSSTSTSKNILYDSLRMFFLNGGGECYVISIAYYSDPIPTRGKYEKALDFLKKVDEPTLILYPDASTLLSSGDLYTLQDYTLQHCADMQDRFAVLDVLSPDLSDPVTDAASFRNGIGMGNLKYGAAYYPWLKCNLELNIRYRDIKGKLKKNSSFINAADLTLDATAQSNANWLDKVVSSNKTIEGEITGLTTAGTTIRERFNELKTAMTSATTNATARDGLEDLMGFLFSMVSAVDHWVDDDTAHANVITDSGSSEHFLEKAQAEITAGFDAIANTLLGYDAEAVADVVKGGATYSTQVIATAASEFTSTPTASTIFDGGLANNWTMVQGAADALQGVFEQIYAGMLKIQGIGQTLESSLEKTVLDEIPPVRNAVKGVNGSLTTLPPSGAIVGVYARVDRNRGVWKAPANESLLGVKGLTQSVTNDDQDKLNVDATSGKSVNAIRSFTGRGILVWGARTLAGNDNEWRYVPVRRLYIAVEESIKKATEFVVFEPNDANTWVRVKGMIKNYLTELWKQGALAGAKPDHAFFVNVGLGETMTAQDILEGRMIIEIGMAAVRPAEFIILRFSHKLQES